MTAIRLKSFRLPWYPAAYLSRPPSMDSPLINRLPPELLITIATLTDRSAILRLSTVCRYWRDVITGTPTFWTSIDCRNEPYTSILLQRSKSSPIDVTITNRYVPAAISLVAKHTHRMRSIDLNLHSRQFKDARPLLKEFAPMLETIRMRPRGDNSLPRSSFFQGEFPALRTLHLEGYSFDLTQSAPIITSGLTTLVLDSGQYHDRRDLFECLEHCKSLLHLRIDLPNLEGTIPASHTVYLPKLRELRSVRSSLSAVRHLSFPPSANLIIEPRVGEYAEAHPLATIWERDGLPQIFELRPIEDIRITFIGTNWVVTLSGPHLVFAEHVKVNWGNYSGCLDSLRFLPTITAEVLRFVQPPRCQFPGALQQQSCTRLLRQMPALKHIIMDDSVAWHLIYALAPIDGQVPCPELRSVVVVRREGHRYHLSNLSALSALSDRRKDHGCPIVCNMGSARSPNWWQVTQLETVA